MLIALCLLVFLPMLIEARLAARNERGQRARGGIEPPADVYAMMRVAYPGAFLVMIGEGAVRGTPAPTVVAVGALLWIAAKALKWWAIRSLGPAWTFRVIVVPGARLVGSGPYRYLRHPNYVAVVGELVAVALMAGARVMGPLATGLFCLLILRRIAVEHRSLGWTRPSSTSRADKTIASHDQRPASGFAIAADWVVVALFLTGLGVAWTGGGVWHFGDLRLSVRSPTRLYIMTAALLALRHFLVPRPSVLALLVRGARAPLFLDEHRLFGPRETAGWGRRIGGFAALTVGFSALVAALTWPQARELYSVPDLGDPLFSIWRIAWISHQLPRDPLSLFDANIFFPERLTLTYSDSLIVPALMSAPFFWLGAHPVLIYNLLFLSGFVLSGVTAFLLVRALTGRQDAAIVSGAIFALYPYRFEHYSHLELQMAMWMPLALWGLHRTLASGRLRDGLATGLAYALQTLSSLYYGAFLAAYMVVLGVALWLGRGRPWRPVGPLVAGALLAAVMIAPVASQYVASKPMMGDRTLQTIETYSAEGPDYLKAHHRTWTYRSWSFGGHAERQLFPGVTPVVLSAVALWPPLSVSRIGYALALALAVDGSLGFNGKVFPWLHGNLSPFRGLRVPARFSFLAGLTLAILAGYGAADLLRRWPRWRAALTGAMLAAVIVEAIPRMPLTPIWHEPPPIYSAFAGRPPTVLAEFPMPFDDQVAWWDTRYLYFSTWHWQKLVNGNSGFFPPSHDELLERVRDFPSEAAIDYLQERGVEYLAFHGAFSRSQDRYRNTIRFLDARSDLELMAAAPWGGSESRLYRLRRPGAAESAPAR